MTKRQAIKPGVFVYLVLYNIDLLYLAKIWLLILLYLTYIYFARRINLSVYRTISYNPLMYIPMSDNLVN